MDIDDLARLAASFLMPLAEAVEDPEVEAILLGDLGFVLPPGATFVASSREALEGLADVAVQVAEFDEAGGGTTTDLLIAIAPALRETIEGVAALAQNIDAATSGSALVANTDVLEVLPRRLVDFLLVDFLMRELPLTFAILQAVGIIELKEVVQEGDPHRQTFTHRTVEWERLPRFFSDPIALIKEQYAWDSAEGIDTDLLFERLRAVGLALGLRSDLRSVDARAKAAFDAALNGAGEVPADEHLTILRLPFLPTTDANVGAELYPIADGAGRVDGVGIAVYVEGQLVVDIPITDWLAAELKLAAFATGFGVALRTGQDPKVVSAIFTDDPAAVLDQIAIDTSIVFSYHSPDGGPIVLLGSAGATRFQIDGLTMTVGLSKPLASPVDLFAEVALPKAALIVQGGDADSFLQSALGDGFSITFDFGLGFSTERGVYFSGSAELDWVIRLSFEAGPIFVDKIGIRIKASPDDTRLVATVTGGLEIGPFVAVVQDIGLAVKVDPKRPGVLGNADLTLGFKPPTGVGLSLETPVVKAAGIVIFDPDHFRYMGGIELSVLKKFDLTIIGLVTTRFPDGTDGWAILLIIAFRFPVPIFIAYNFYLAGVGGILGLNRTIDVDRMRRGLQAGSLESILFPTDIVKRLDQIVTDLEEIFPAERDQFLVGPMALIEWSQPALIRVKLGLVIEFAHPVRIAILGILEAALPDPDEAVLSLKVAFLGLIDIEKGLLSFDASIYDSYLGYGDWKFSLEGDIAMRLSFGARKDFVNSVGGFHPLYTPPTDLSIPPLRRIAISLLKDNPHLSLSCYFAVTTNTIQFGARIDLLFKVSGFSIVGDLGFDVLFQFSPFRFLAEVHGHLAVKAGGSEILSISIEFTLAGPGPWIARGHASFKILFFKVKADFEKRFGEDATDTLPEVAVLPRLIEELGKDTAWRGELGPGATTLVTLIERARQPGEILVDAAGVVAATQGILPLGTEFTLFASARPSDARLVRISQVQIANVAVDTGDEFDSFAPAAFHELSDPEKLKASAYESMPSGFITRGVGAARTEQVVPRPVRYERIVSDLAAPGAASGAPSRIARPPRAKAGKGEFERLVPGGAIRRSAQSIANARDRQKGSVVGGAAIDERFAVLSTIDLRPVDDAGTAVDPIAHENGRPVYTDGVLVSRSAAEARRAALLSGGKDSADFEVAPEAQLAA
jgi:hypothetical protein